MPLGGLATAGLIAGGGAAVLKGLGGVAQYIFGKKAEKNNVRPTYEIPEEFQQNLAMAKNMAQVGLPQEQYNNAMTGINRNQAGGLRVLGNSSNPAAGLASIVRAGNDATNGLNVQDANARLQNQRLVLQQNGVLGQQELAKQQYDKFDKYNEFDQKAQQLKQAGLTNAFGAVNELGQLGMISATQGQNQPYRNNTPLQAYGLGMPQQQLTMGLPNYAYGNRFSPYGQ